MIYFQLSSFKRIIKRIYLNVLFKPIITFVCLYILNVSYYLKQPKVSGILEK